MNRQQRRAAKRSGAKPPAGTAPGGGSDVAVAGLFDAALAHHRTGAVAEAERQYRRVLELSPTHADSLQNLGIIALQRGDAAAAVELIGKAIAVNDQVADYHYNAALAWRALNRDDEVAAHLERTVALRGDHALAHQNLGNVRREQGRPAEAIACYERAIAAAPNLAAARFNLANVLVELGRWDAAIAQYNQALAIEPNRAEAYDILGQAYLATGDIKSAILAAARAVELKETAPAKTFFAQCLRYGRFTSDNSSRFRNLTLRALAEGWTHPRELVRVGLSLVLLDGAIGDCVARANAAWPKRLTAPELYGTAGLQALLRDELLHCLLQSAPLTDIGFERFLTSARAGLLGAAEADRTCDDATLDFYCALARQCFENDYVYGLADGEAAQAERLRLALDQALAEGRKVSPLWPVAVAAYGPLAALNHAEALLAQSAGQLWPQCIGALLTQQITEPAEERRLAAAMPALTSIDSEVSRSVRQQYEENPYPRWAKVALPAEHTLLAGRKAGQIPEVLIAGCGTGLSAVTFAQQAPDARILAIDLSRASLAYAKRMANALGFGNIEFAQADITKLDALDRSFDFIDSSGVLHHLGDPWQGWRVLLSLLRSGGMMQVGLYSKLARQSVTAARALIAERGYRPIAEDIRRCREEIVAAPDGSLLRSASAFSDFFTTNECRDLLFHVQEHQMTLPEIKAFLAEAGVEFAGFVLDAGTRQRFLARFAEAGSLFDLDRWHLYETEAPATFSAMYQFFVRKP